MTTRFTHAGPGRPLTGLLLLLMVLAFLFAGGKPPANLLSPSVVSPAEVIL